MIQPKEENRVLMDGLDIDWVFPVRETMVFQMMWRSNENIATIARKLKREGKE